GKLILCGEHAVVFGEPALATAINLRAEVYARTHPEWRADGGSIDEPRYRYVRAAIAKVKTSGPLWLEVRSMVPSGAGLGSSAAVTVATLGTLHGMGGSLDAKTIAREAFEVEHEVQGRASPIDTSTASAGGCLLVLPKPQGDLLWTIERDARRWCLHRTDLPPLDFVIGNTGISAARRSRRVARPKERRSSSGRIRSEWRPLHEAGPSPQDPRDPRRTVGRTEVPPHRPRGRADYAARTRGPPPARDGGGPRARRGWSRLRRRGTHRGGRADRGRPRAASSGQREDRRDRTDGPAGLRRRAHPCGVRGFPRA